MKLRFAKFCVSSVIAFAVDNGVFHLVLMSLAGAGMWRRNAILVAIVVARVISSFVNFVCNRRMVFRSHAAAMVAAWRYYALVAAILVASYLLTSGISSLVDARGIAITGVKIAVETLLFVVSFRVQRGWVYRPSGGRTARSGGGGK